jgi:succinoglycan biosynthesis protein ExoU
MGYTILHKMNASNSSVTVIIPAYNSSVTIGRAIRSALAEAETAEVIIVDDASSDNTVDRASAADDGTGRLKVITQPSNRGPSAARNLALRNSAAPWIAILDADDFFLPGRLKGLLRFADDADFIADDLWQVREDAIDGPRRLLLGGMTPPRLVGFQEFVLSNVWARGRQRQVLAFIKPLMRRNFLDAHNITYQENMRIGEDYELYARALALGAKLLLVPEAQGYVYVMRSNSLTGQHSEFDLLQLRDCDHALSATPGLSVADKAALRQQSLSVDCRLQWRLLINAVKQKDKRAALSCFARPYPVPVYLLGQLAEQAILRSSRRWRSRPRK